MKKTFVMVVVLIFALSSYGVACQADPKDTSSSANATATATGGAGGQGGQGGAGGTGYGGNASAEGGSASINSKYEDLREMAMVVGASVTTALRFKEGAHSDITDSRIMKVEDIIDLLETVSYEECKRGKGPEGDVKIIDGLIRPQVVKTTEVTFHTKMVNKKRYRFIGYLTGVAGVNDLGMENVVYGIGQATMEAGGTDAVLVKQSATEWGDTSGYAFDIGGFVTSIIGGAGSRAIGPGGSAGAGYNNMKGGSADRGDCKFAIFVSQEQLEKVSAQHIEKK